jgi:predicted methyltransferase
LDFLGIGRGERIADVGSSPADLIERMADAVGPTGEVYARHDPRVLVAPARRGAAARREGTLPDHVIVMDTPDSAPFSARAKNLNLVTMLYAYHDLVSRGTDRLAFNRAVFEALAPGGVYVIAEHAAAPGAGVAEVREGRVEERIIREDVEAAGFAFVEAAELSSSRARPSAAGTQPGPGQLLLKFRRTRS